MQEQWRDQAEKRALHVPCFLLFQAGLSLLSSIPSFNQPLSFPSAQSFQSSCMTHLNLNSAHFCRENGDSRFLQNTGNCLHDYIVSQSAHFIESVICFMQLDVCLITWIAILYCVFSHVSQDNFSVFFIHLGEINKEYVIMFLNLKKVQFFGKML